MERSVKVGGLRESLETEAKHILVDFQSFAHGTRCLMLLHRTKDGGENKEFHRRGGMYITHSPAEWYTALFRLMQLQVLSDKPYRIYASVNPRDMAKAEKAFKMDMLTADFDSGENKKYFWDRLESKWMGSLMKPGSRTKNSQFMLDIDGDDKVVQSVLKWLAEKEIAIFKQYQTPNGWHIITDPFNPEELQVEGCEVKKDGLLLIKS